jgi:hypothetical protein
MSGYSYGNPGDGYSSPYGMDNTGYPNYPPNNSFQPPPPVPMYGDNQSCASLYGTYGSSMPSNNNYSAPPYDVSQMPSNNNYSAPPYGVSQIPGSSYGYGGDSGYPPAPTQGGQIPSPIFNQPPQQYGGK